MVGRRDFLQKAGMGCGLLALGDLLARESAAGEEISADSGPPSPHRTHFPAKAKSIVWLFMEGAPSSVDLFDPKPELDKTGGKANRHRDVQRRHRPADEVAVPL